jgi:hypothetical protein
MPGMAPNTATPVKQVIESQNFPALDTDEILHNENRSLWPRWRVLPEMFSRYGSTLSLLAGSTNFTPRCNSHEACDPKPWRFCQSSNLPKCTKPCSRPFFL